MVCLLVLFYLTSSNAGPIGLMMDSDLEKLDGFLPKMNDLPKFSYNTFGETNDDNDVLNVIEFKSALTNRQDLGDTGFLTERPPAGTDLFSDVKDLFMTTLKPETTTNSEETTTTFDSATVNYKENIGLNPVLTDYNGNRTAHRMIRQEEVNESNDNSSEEKNKMEGEATTGDKENQEEEEAAEPENMAVGLISAFLSGLSKPDGGVDLEGLTGLLGSLSTQKEDGTYEFSGLTDLLQSFFSDEGGSDVSAFVAGLTGALLQGLARPPGAKGVGIFLGKLVAGILPGLSAPAPTEEGVTQKPQPPLDSGSFLGGFLKSFLGGVGNFSGGSSGGGNTNGMGGGSKFSLFKAVFSMITSIFSSSSHYAH